MSLPDSISSVAHYDEIPQECLGKTILDIGSSDGYGAVHSRHRDHFLACDYLGIDIQGFQRSYLLSIIKADILEFETEKRFDTILMLHVLEHIVIERWFSLFQKLDSLLERGGFLVVNVPFNKPAYPEQERELKAALFHEVGKIDETLLSQYWDFQKYLYFGKQTAKVVVFRDPGENFFRSCVRFVLRILTHHKYSVIRRYVQLKKPARIVAIYQKKGVRNSDG